MNKVQYCKAQIEDRTIFFSLTASQLYGSDMGPVPIHWEVEGQVFVGELELSDLAELDIQPDR